MLWKESTRIFIQVQKYPACNKVKFSVPGIESNVPRLAKKSRKTVPQIRTKSINIYQKQTHM